MTQPRPLSVVADVGGTNTRVALADSQSLLTDTIRRYRNAEFGGLDAVLAAFLAETGATCAAASVAIAGPVRDGRGRLTNLDWNMDEAELADVTGAHIVAVLNDLQAQGHALGHLPPDALREVIPGPAIRPREAQLVIGVGTGFNVAPVHHLGAARLVAAAEAGHATLPIRTDAELGLARFVERVHGVAAIEDVLSGRGLERLHAWRCGEAGRPGGASAAEVMAACGGGEPLAEEAVAWFVRLLGRVAGDLALGHLPFGGVFLAGGVARAMLPYMDRFGFSDAFREKGRFSGFMGNFAVHAIEDDCAALIGSAAHLQRLATVG